MSKKKLPLKTPVVDVFAEWCVAEGLPRPRAEIRFHETRKWRFDWAFTDKNVLVAVECEGGVWSGGRHTSGVGFTKDCEKYAEAACLGWLVLRFTTTQIKDGTAIRILKRVIPLRVSQIGEKSDARDTCEEITREAALGERGQAKAEKATEDRASS